MKNWPPETVRLAQAAPESRDALSSLAAKIQSAGNDLGTPCARLTIPEVARRLNIGRMAVYAMLERGQLPGIRVGKRWIITRHAYEQWERTCGMAKPSTILN